MGQALGQRDKLHPARGGGGQEWASGLPACLAITCARLQELRYDTAARDTVLAHRLCVTPGPQVPSFCVTKGPRNPSPFWASVSPSVTRRWHFLPSWPHEAVEGTDGVFERT